MTTDNSNTNGKAKRQNFIAITLQAAAEPEVKYAKSGKPWGSIRAFFSQGKNDAGEFLPSMWFTVKVFSKTDQIEGALAALQGLSKGDKFVAKGKLVMEEWTGTQDGIKHQSYVITFASIEPVVAEAEAEGEALEGEPA